MFPDGIPVGGDRYKFDTCPGYYIRSYDSFTVDGHQTPFDISWSKHWAFSAGQDVPYAPKLVKAIELIESERRAREALSVEDMKNKAREQQARQRHGDAKKVIHA